MFQPCTCSAENTVLRHPNDKMHAAAANSATVCSPLPLPGTSDPQPVVHRQRQDEHTLAPPTSPPPTLLASLNSHTGCPNPRKAPAATKHTATATSFQPVIFTTLSQRPAHGPSPRPRRLLVLGSFDDRQSSRDTDSRCRRQVQHHADSARCRPGLAGPLRLGRRSHPGSLAPAPGLLVRQVREREAPHHASNTTERRLGDVLVYGISGDRRVVDVPVQQLTRPLPHL